MSLKSLFTKKPATAPAKPKEPEIRTLKEGREFPKEIKDIKVTSSLLVKANNVFVGDNGEYYLHDGYNSYEYIGCLPSGVYHANIGVIVNDKD